MKELVIATGDGEKGRSFRATLLSYVLAFRDGADTIRPAWMTVAASTAEAGPFLANLRKGRKAEVPGDKKPDRFELLRSAGYAFAQQRHPEGVAITAYLPELFAIDPGMVDPSGVRFVVLPSKRWAPAVDGAAVAHARRVYPDRPLDQVAALAPVAPLFAAYLDRRTRCPLIPDAGFYLQILIGALGEGLASLSSEERRGTWGEKAWGRHGLLEEHDTESVGLLPGVACRCSHQDLERLLAGEVAKFYAAAGGRRAA